MKIRSSGESPLLLLNIIKLLNRLRIPYAIVGAFAASFYGWVRATLDADAVISVRGDDEKFRKLLLLFENAGLKVQVNRGDFLDPVGCVVNIRDKFHNRVDLLMGVRGMRDEVYGRVKTAVFMKQKIKVVGIEDFIAMKIYGGSVKDLQDVTAVLEAGPRRLNLPLLKKLTLQYGTKEFKKLQNLLKSKSI